MRVLTMEQATAMVADSAEVRAKRLAGMSDRALDDLEEWAASWAEAPDGSLRLLPESKSGKRRRGRPIPAAVLRRILSEVRDEQHSRAMRDDLV